jgi:RNA polymerase sigma factor (sigma-70 family)
MRAAQSQAQGGRSALAELCRLYWYPLYTFARRRGRSPEDAQDSAQSFFLHMVEHRAFKGVDRLKGKFRSFLLASFQNHLSDAVDRARRLKRGADKDFVHLDAEDAEKRYRLEPIDFLTAEKISKAVEALGAKIEAREFPKDDHFDARWAMTVLGEALKKLCQEYALGGKASTFEALKVFLDPNNSMTPPLVRPGGESTSDHDRRGQNTYPSVAKALHRAVARGGRSHGFRSGRN